MGASAMFGGCVCVCEEKEEEYKERRKEEAQSV
jgi:hypothetical protein